jgi:hypothetical protein
VVMIVGLGGVPRKVEIGSLFHVEDFGLTALVAETKRGRLIVNVRRSRVQASLSEA